MSIEPSQAFKDYLAGIAKLDALWERGLGESQEYEDICDSLDLPWNKMTASEREQIRRGQRHGPQEELLSEPSSSEDVR